MWYVVRAAGCATIAMPDGEIRKVGGVSLKSGIRYLYWEDENVLYSFTGYLRVRMKYCSDECKHVFRLPNLTVYMDCGNTKEDMWVKIPYIDGLAGVMELFPKIEYEAAYGDGIMYSKTVRVFDYIHLAHKVSGESEGLCGMVVIHDGEKFLSPCPGITLTCTEQDVYESGDVAFVSCKVSNKGVFNVVAIEKLGKPEYILEDWEGNEGIYKVMLRPSSPNEFAQMLCNDVGTCNYDIEDLYLSLKDIVLKSVSRNIIDTLAWAAAEFLNTR